MFDLSILGVKKNIPKVNFTDHTGIIVAEGKFGKTTIASKFPNSIIVPFEEGTKGQVANVVETLNDWDDFIEFIDKLEDNREAIGNNVQTIVFDTVNKAWELTEPYALSKLGIADKKQYKKPSDVPHGQFYPFRDKVFVKEIDRILKMGFSILFLTHSKVKTVNPKDGESYDVYSSTMPQRLEDIIYPLVDFMIFGERRVVEDSKGNKVPKRVLVTRGKETVSAGGRVRLDSDIEFDTEDEAMEKFQAQFKERMIELLREHGITDDFDTISKQQTDEKLDKIKREAEEKRNLPSKEDVIEEINTIIKALSKTEKLQAKTHAESILGTMVFDDVEDVKKLVEFLEALKEI